MNNLNINEILDYGSGNGKLAKLLSDNFKVTEFDIGMCDNKNSYDCVIVSHVLEHIYDLDTFISNVKKILIIMDYYILRYLMLNIIMN